MILVKPKVIQGSRPIHIVPDELYQTSADRMFAHQLAVPFSLTDSKINNTAGKKSSFFIRVSKIKFKVNFIVKKKQNFLSRKVVKNFLLLLQVADNHVVKI